MATSWIWSETVSAADLIRPATLGLLRRFQLRPLVAVQPRALAELAELTRVLRAEGIDFGLWPMLDDAAGRWASVSNMLDYLGFCDQVLDRASAALPSALAIDLEPSIEWVRPLVCGKLPRLGQGSGSSFGAARSALLSYVASIQACGLHTLAAAVPLVLHEGLGEHGWQRALGTPVTEMGFDQVTAMAYPSLVEGWSRGTLTREHARGLLVTWAKRAAARGLGLSLGAVGPGAFGNEPRYRSPHELAEDVALARRYGVTDITLLDLGGVLTRPPAEGWLEALSKTAAESVPPAPSRRVRALVATLDLGGRILG